MKYISGVILIVLICAIILGAVSLHDVYEEEVRKTEDNLRDCNTGWAETQQKLSVCATERDQLQAQIAALNAEIDRLSGEKARLEDEKATLQSELANTNSALSKTHADLTRALVNDYAINGLIALGLVILGAAIGLAIPFTLYLGGVITVAEPKGS